MSMGTDGAAAQSETTDTTDREPGGTGPPPYDERTEIRWARHDGIELVVKAAGDGRRDRLRREADVLRRCAGLPVVDLVECSEGADHTEIVTRRFGSVTLTDAGLLDPEERGAALAGFCEAVRVLHDGGWAHGAIEPSHVLVSPGRGVRLCSLSDASQVEGTVSTSRSADVDALSSVVLGVLSEPAGFDSFRARRRWDRAARRATTRLNSARGLFRPEQVLEVLRGVGLPGTAHAPEHTEQPISVQRTHDALEVRRPRPDRPSRRPRRGSAIAVSLLAALAVAAAVLAGDPTGEADDPSTGPTCPDVNGDGDCEAVAVDGTDLVVDGRRFEVGRPQDVVRVGDWDCDGVHTAAVLRPSTGEVFSFDEWAEEGRPLDGRLLGVHSEAVELAEPEACGPVRVVGADGTVTAVTAVTDRDAD